MPIKHILIASLVLASASGAACNRRGSEGGTTPAETVASGRGAIKGRVRLLSAPPANPAIRMSADPMCERATGGKQVLQEIVVVDADGALANVLIRLEGSFPRSAAPTTAVEIDQRGCVYTPRVVGLQIGQSLRIRNSDPGLHNVHGGAGAKEAFNIGQPTAGMVNEFALKEEGVLQLQCDVHRWMLAFVGVVSHPYFAVTNEAGTYEIRDAPAGTYTVSAWHERYGRLTSTVRVERGTVNDADFAYSGDQK